MLQGLRAGAGSLVAKIILVLLIASFALWGIADYTFGPNDENTAATVDGQEISLQQLADAYREDLVRGNLAQITPDIQQSLNLAQITLDRLINERLIANEIAKMDLQISDELVALTIASDPEFQRQDGSFNRTAFQSMLLNNGLSEADFIANYRMDMARRWVELSLFPNHYGFDGFQSLVYSYRSKRMDVGVLTLTASQDDIPDLPTEAELRQYYNDNQEDFRQPEYRDISFIWLSTQRLASQIEVDEAVLLSEYEARKNNLGTAEKRMVTQIRIPSDSSLPITLDEISQRLNEGMGVDGLIENGLIEEGYVSALGLLGRSDFPDVTLSEAAFALDKGKASAPIDGLFGEVVLYIEDIMPAYIPSFDEVKASLALVMARQEAVKRLPEDVRLLDDMIGQGERLEDVARTIGVALEAQTISRNGVDENGRSLTLPSGGFLPEVFAMAENELGFVNQNEAGDIYIARINAIMPSTIPAYEVVKDEVELSWIGQELTQRLEAKSDNIIQEIKNHQGPERINLSGLATKYGAGMKIFNRIDRNGQALAGGEEQAQIRQSIANAVFALDLGEADLQPLESAFNEFLTIDELTPSIGFQIFMPLNIYEGEQSQDAEMAQNVKDNVMNSFRQDSFAHYIEYLRKNSDIQTNQNAVNRLYQ